MSSTIAERAARIRIVAFDVDGTLVHHPQHQTVWQILNRRWLTPPGLNRERFEAYRAGRITYAEWVALDIGDWSARGVRRAQIVDAIRAELCAAPGASETVATLNARGYRLIVVSGTLDLTIELLLPELSFHRVFTNRIWFQTDGRIRGWRATPFDVAGKAVAFTSLARAHGWDAEHVAFIGDGWNDISALRAAGLGIAVHPKEQAVREAAQVVIEEGSLTQLLALLPGAPAHEGRR